jgi:hypothetical protein
MATHRIKQNRYGNWAAYTSGKHVQYFFNSHLAGGNAGADDQQQQAEAWLLAQNRAEVLAKHGADLARLQRGFNRTTLEVTTTDVGFAGALVAIAEERQLPVLATPVLIGRAKRVPHVRVTVRASAHDIEVAGSGESVLLIHGTSPEGVDWLHENVQHEPWQALAGRLGVEHRFIASIIEGATAAGLSVRVL